MLESVVDGTGENIECRSQLGNVKQPLKKRMMENWHYVPDVY